MSESSSNLPDTFACKRKLALALGHRDLEIENQNSIPHQNAVFWVAIALGNCRLHGVDPEEYDGLLTISMAAAAIRAANRLLKDYERKLIDCSINFDELDEDATICACQVIADRMDLWAADIAITETWELAIDEEELGHRELDDLVVLFSENVLQIDEALEKCSALLYTAASTNLLSNWRQLLAPKYKSVLPWWLDGSIESEMQTAASFAASIIPADAPASEGENRNDCDGAHLVSVATTTRLDDESSSGNLTPGDLIEQIIQNELQGTPGALAAEWNDDSSPLKRKLFAYRCSVEGDANVKIRFETKCSDQGTAQVIVHLVGRRADTQKYQQVILRLEGGSEKIEPIINRAAIFHLAADAWNGLPKPKLWLVDGDGLERAVDS